MTTTKSSGACTAFRIPSQFPSTGSTVSAGECLSAVFMEKGMPDLSGAAAGIEISPEEMGELRMFDEFLSRHVQPNMIRDVQCRLLWNEWVRSFRRQTHAFPNLILEKEFSSVVMDRFSVGIAEDGFRGAVYPGIRYVP
jgi:hypothetical protein